MLEPRTTLPKLTDRLTLGDGLAVSPICLGLVGDPAVVPAAFEAGINFFFVTADMHWPLYEGTRRGLYDLLRSKPRDEIVVAVVSYATQPEFCRMPFSEVVDYIPPLERVDLMIAGGSYGDELERRLEIYGGHRTQRFLGARAIGTTFHDRTAVLPVLERRAVDIGFVRCNPMHPKAEAEVFPHVRDDHPLLFNFKSTWGCLTEAELRALGVGEDYWVPHPTTYYRFALTQPALDGLLVALPSPATVRELSDALAKGPLDDEDRQYLLDLGELARGKATLAPAG
jgi:hypothetical protein